MAAAFENSWKTPLIGAVVTREGYARPTKTIKVFEASHPVPDARGVAAAERILALVKDATADDLVVCLVSGGASALLSLPREGVSLADKRSITDQLLKSGASITEINCVRKHLSAIKGGRLAEAAFPARVVSLIISDVVGDHIEVIGSGPTAPDTSTCVLALEAMERYRVPIPEVIRKGLSDRSWETLKRPLPNVTNKIIARPRDALTAAGTLATQKGLMFLDLGDAFAGDAAAVAAEHTQYLAPLLADRSPVLLLSGGEATVKVQGTGTGGPNTEFALHMAMAMERLGTNRVWVLAADTDGTDGVGNQAGALIDPGLIARARKAGLDPAQALSNNDSGGFLRRAGGILETGPTYTNVNDFRAVLVAPKV